MLSTLTAGLHIIMNSLMLASLLACLAVILHNIMLSLMLASLLTSKPY